MWLINLIMNELISECGKWYLKCVVGAGEQQRWRWSVTNFRIGGELKMSMEEIEMPSSSSSSSSSVSAMRRGLDVIDGTEMITAKGVLCEKHCGSLFFWLELRRMIGIGNLECGWVNDSEWRGMSHEIGAWRDSPTYQRMTHGINSFRYLLELCRRVHFPLMFVAISSLHFFKKKRN